MSHQFSLHRTRLSNSSIQPQAAARKPPRLTMRSIVFAEKHQLLNKTDAAARLRRSLHWAALLWRGRRLTLFANIAVVISCVGVTKE